MPLEIKELSIKINVSSDNKQTLVENNKTNDEPNLTNAEIMYTLKRLNER